MLNNPNLPSAKTLLAGLLSFVVAFLAFVQEAQLAGIEPPAWLVIVVAVVSPVLVYLKPETNPSASAIEVASTKVNR